MAHLFSRLIILFVLIAVFVTPSPIKTRLREAVNEASKTTAQDLAQRWGPLVRDMGRV